MLKNHELTHSGVKKYVCHICNAKFIQRYNLKVSNNINVIMFLLACLLNFSTKKSIGNITARTIQLIISNIQYTGGGVPMIFVECTILILGKEITALFYKSEPNNL